jgi:hypothetical protein
MKKTTLLVMVLVMLLLATPAFAGPKEPVGGQIELYCDEGERYCQGTREFPAQTPFHISHGWLLLPTWGDQPGQFTFELELDGTIVSPTYVDRWTELTEWGPVLYGDWVYNYPDGMSGGHTFVGSWIGPCGLALELGLVDECANPMADFEWARVEYAITFYE